MRVRRQYRRRAHCVHVTAFQSESAHYKESLLQTAFIFNLTLLCKLQRRVLKTRRSTKAENDKLVKTNYYVRVCAVLQFDDVSLS